MKTIAIVSGGMDSVVMAYHLKSFGRDLTLLSFDYGQRHVKELDSVRVMKSILGAKSLRMQIDFHGHLKGSALTDPNVDVPEGHYQSPTMAATVVPNRNAVMLSIAYAIAVAEHAEEVAIGVHAGDHAVYPDCRPEFIRAFDAMQRVAVAGFGHPALALNAPFVTWSKADIAREGARLGVPFELTWSCYKGEHIHCGRCGTCMERREALHLAGVADLTVYE